MPTTPLNVTQARHAVRYTGMNSADIAGLIDDFTVVSEDASQLTFTSDGETLSVPRNGWLSYRRGMVTAEDVFANDDDFYDEYADLATADQHVHQIILTSGPAQAADAEGEE